MININMVILYGFVLIALLFFLYFEKIKKFFVNEANSNNEKYRKICPKCGSTDVQTDFSNPVVWAYGANTKYKCRSCGHISALFPEISKYEIKSYKKELKKKIGEGVINAKKELVDISSGFSIGLFEMIFIAIGYIFVPLMLFLHEGSSSQNSNIIVVISSIWYLILGYFIFKIGRSAYQRK